jgi:hypothetical protein
MASISAAVGGSAGRVNVTGMGGRRLRRGMGLFLAFDVWYNDWFFWQSVLAERQKLLVGLST